MAGTPGQSGGMRPNAPQNNPANISATGGNGQSGATQAPKYIPGMKALGSTGTETMAQQGAAAMSAGPAPVQEDFSLFNPSKLPNELISAGVDDTAGPDSSVLPSQFRDQRPVENMDIIKKYLPDLVNAARIEGAPDTYKSFVNYLIGKVQ